MATLAFFMTLGGVSYAAVSLPANSVGTAQLRSGAVTGPKVRSRSLTYSDLNPKARTLLHGSRGLRGLRGPKGNQGIKGIPGPMTDSVELGGSPTPIPAGSLEYLSASGLGTPSTTVPNAEYIPSAEDLTATRLFVHVDMSPSSGHSWSFALNDGLGDTSVACTIPAGGNTCWSSSGVTATFHGPVELDAFGTPGAAQTRAEWGWEAAPTQ